MKTDKEKVIGLLTELGIGFTKDVDYFDSSISNVVIDSDSASAEGYAGFYTVFEFDDDGKFQVIGIWE